MAELIHKNVTGLDGAIHTLAHPYIRYVDPDAEGATRHKTSGTFAVNTAANAAHALVWSVTANAYLWAPEKLDPALPRKKIVCQLCDAENPADDDEVISFVEAYRHGTLLVAGRGMPLTEQGNVRSQIRSYAD